MVFGSLNGKAELEGGFAEEIVHAGEMEGLRSQADYLRGGGIRRE